MNPFQRYTISIFEANMATARRSNSVFESRTPLKSGKLPVAEPTSVKQFLLVLVMHACKRVLLLTPMFRVGVYLCGVTFGALVTDLAPFPKTYFANKSNLFNQWFVKFSWGWTMILVGFFIYLTSFTYCCGKLDLIKKHLSRLGVATAWWYFWTSVFNFIEHTTGYCTTDGYYNKKTCIAANGFWNGFDVSGHAFILIYCSLIISEEVRVMKFWSRLPEVIQTEEERFSERLSEEKMTIVKHSYLDNLVYVRVLAVALTYLIIIWDMMLLSTILYFHNMPQKLTGGALGILGWYVTYQLWYRSNQPSPGVPGKGLVKFMKD